MTELLLFALLASAPLKIASSVDGGAPSTDWKYVRVNQAVELHAPPVRGARHLRWFELVPTTRAVNNTEPSFHFEPLAYARRELPECRDQRRCPVATSAPGPRAFQLEATLQSGETRSSPGLEATELGGLGRDVHKIAIRKDDTYVGMLTELLGTPYIFGSSGDGRRFQPELLIGSDCADLVVYGARRQGRKIAYTSSYGLRTVAPKLRVAERSGEGGEVREGDILHFPGTRHVGVLYEDRAPRGVLDDDDLIIHTCWAPATIERLRDTGCASWPVNVHRLEPLPDATPRAGGSRPARRAQAPR